MRNALIQIVPLLRGVEPQLCSRYRAALSLMVNAVLPS